VLVNSCTVKNPSQDAFLQTVLASKKARKPLVVAGCVPQGDRGIQEIAGVSVVGVAQIDRVVEVVEQTLQGNTVQLLEKNRLPSLDLPKVRRNKFIEMWGADQFAYQHGLPGGLHLLQDGARSGPAGFLQQGGAGAAGAVGGG
jgi:hypothetical protein